MEKHEQLKIKEKYIVIACVFAVIFIYCAVYILPSNDKNKKTINKPHEIKKLHKKWKKDLNEADKHEEEKEIKKQNEEIARKFEMEKIKKQNEEIARKFEMEKIKLHQEKLKLEKEKLERERERNRIARKRMEQQYQQITRAQEQQKQDSNTYKTSKKEKRQKYIFKKIVELWNKKPSIKKGFHHKEKNRWKFPQGYFHYCCRCQKDKYGKLYTYDESHIKTIVYWNYYIRIKTTVMNTYKISEYDFLQIVEKGQKNNWKETSLFPQNKTHRWPYFDAEQDEYWEDEHYNCANW